MLDEHPYATMFPRADSAEELAELKADLQEVGQQTPIMVFEGKVLDGRRRQKVLDELGIEPVYQTFTGDKAAALAYAWSHNMPRRSLTKSQEALARAQRAKFLQEMRKEEGVRGEGDVSELVSQDNAVNARTVRRAMKVLSQAEPEVVDAVREGNMSVTEASSLADKPAEEQRSAVSRPRKKKQTTSNELVRDAFGVRVPTRLRDHFASDIVYDMAKKCSGMIKLAKDVSSWNTWLPVSTVVEHLETLRSLLSNAIPHAVCQKCKGAACPTCKNSGFVPEAALVDLRATGDWE